MNMVSWFSAIVIASLTAVMFFTGLIAAIFGVTETQAPLFITLVFNTGATMFVALITQKISFEDRVSQPLRNDERGKAAFAFTNSASVLGTIVTSASEIIEIRKISDTNGITMILDHLLNPDTFVHTGFYFAILTAFTFWAIVLIVIGSRVLSHSQSLTSKQINTVTMFSMLLLSLWILVGTKWQVIPYGGREVASTSTIVVYSLLVIAISLISCFLSLYILNSWLRWISEQANGLLVFAKNVSYAQTAKFFIGLLSGGLIGGFVGFAIAASLVFSILYYSQEFFLLKVLDLEPLYGTIGSLAQYSYSVGVITFKFVAMTGLVLLILRLLVSLLLLVGKVTFVFVNYCYRVLSAIPRYVSIVGAYVRNLNTSIPDVKVQFPEVNRIIHLFAFDLNVPNFKNLNVSHKSVFFRTIGIFICFVFFSEYSGMTSYDKSQSAIELPTIGVEMPGGYKARYWRFGPIVKRPVQPIKQVFQRVQLDCSAGTERREVYWSYGSSSRLSFGINDCRLNGANNYDTILVVGTASRDDNEIGALRLSANRAGALVSSLERKYSHSNVWGVAVGKSNKFDYLGKKNRDIYAVDRRVIVFAAKEKLLWPVWRPSAEETIRSLLGEYGIRRQYKGCALFAGGVGYEQFKWNDDDLNSYCYWKYHDRS